VTATQARLDLGPVWTIVVAAGSGSRFGAAKQYELLGHQRVLDWSVEAARRVSDGVVVVVPAEDAAREHGVPGGSTRSESVRAGLAAVPADAAVVCVHDACRPLAGEHLFRAVIGAVAAGADAAVPGLEVADTIKVVDATNRVLTTPQRHTLRAVQTPQAFRAAILRAVHARGGEATDDAALVEANGGTVMVVPGDERARKITTPDDLLWARAQLGDGT
jgi:2-C-methyl-D-erythritol 4-phosphate cytidylyltransferase